MATEVVSIQDLPQEESFEGDVLSALAQGKPFAFMVFDISTDKEKDSLEIATRFLMGNGLGSDTPLAKKLMQEVIGALPDDEETS